MPDEIVLMKAVDGITRLIEIALYVWFTVSVAGIAAAVYLWRKS